MARMPGVIFQPPKSWSAGRPGGPPRFVVIHHTAGSEGVSAAENGVAYDQRRTDGTSAHFHIDRDDIIQCVDTANRSHTAMYHGNLWGIHLELAGTLQTRAQWLDEASRATIRNSAKVCAWAMKTHGIPLARLVGRQVRTGKGLCGHVDCTTGFPEDGGTHTDPGPHFPWDVLFADIRAELAEAPKTAGGDDMSESWSQNVRSPELGTHTRDDWLKGGRAAVVEAKAARADIALLTSKVDALASKVDQAPAPAIDYDQLAAALAPHLAALREGVADEIRDRMTD